MTYEHPTYVCVSFISQGIIVKISENSDLNMIADMSHSACHPVYTVAWSPSKQVSCFCHPIHRLWTHKTDLWTMKWHCPASVGITPFSHISKRFSLNSCNVKSKMLQNLWPTKMKKVATICRCSCHSFSTFIYTILKKMICIIFLTITHRK